MGWQNDLTKVELQREKKQEFNFFAIVPVLLERFNFGSIWMPKILYREVQ